MKDPLIRQLEEATKADEARTEALKRFPIQKIGDAEIRPAKYLISRVYEENSQIAVVGASGAAKSLVVQDQGFCIASGIAWHGRKTHPRAVLYICGEGFHGVRRRLLGLANKKYRIDLATVPFYIAPGITLSDPHFMTTVKLAIEAIFNDYPAPGLIIVDTWASALGADENSTADTVAGLSALTELAKPYGAAVLIVHHTGHGDKSRARGSSALHAAMDAVYIVEKGDDGIVRVSSLKAKDFEPPPPMAFRIIPVELDNLLDEEGKPETSVILEPIEYEPEKAPREAAGKWQRPALDTLRDLIAQHQKNLEAKGFDPEGAKVSADDWRHACLDAGIPRNRFYDIRKSFIEAGVVIEEAGYVHLR